MRTLIQTTGTCALLAGLALVTACSRTRTVNTEVAEKNRYPATATRPAEPLSTDASGNAIDPDADAAARARADALKPHDTTPEDRFPKNHPKDTAHDLNDTDDVTSPLSKPINTPADPVQSDADTKLAAQIRTAIMGDQTCASSADSVTVVVHGSTVTLQGRVRDPEQKDEFEKITKSVPGVEKVENLLVTLRD